PAVFIRNFCNYNMLLFMWRCVITGQNGFVRKSEERQEAIAERQEATGKRQEAKGKRQEARGGCHVEH
ncbi:MAG: hypothetical protein V2A79_17145, partial [Planctomycetota bacterium]